MKFFLLLGCSALAFGQSFEASASVGESLQSNATLGQLASGSATYSLNSGFNIAFRATLNTWVFFGQEAGYSYNRTHLNAAALSPSSMAIQQGFYNFLGYATPQGSRIRPFGAVGAHFNNYSSPESSGLLGADSNKFGINYGGGVKIRLKGPLGLRFDVHQYLNGKPFDLTGASGWIRQTEISAGVALML